MISEVLNLLRNFHLHLFSPLCSNNAVEIVAIFNENRHENVFKIGSLSNRDLDSAVHVLCCCHMMYKMVCAKRTPRQDTRNWEEEENHFIQKNKVYELNGAKFD